MTGMGLPRLLVFDLDGTLIDSSLDLCLSVNAMLEQMGRPALPHAVIASYIGDGAAMLVRRALGDPGDLDGGDRDESELRAGLDLFIRYYRAHLLDHTRPYPGVMEALTAIRKKAPGVLMAVLTNKPVGPSRAICDALGISALLFANYGGDSFAAKKPDPTGIRTILREAEERLGTTLAPGEVVMIGDSDVDVLTGRAVGARTVGCGFGLAPHALRAAGPDVLVESASEWPRVLGFA